MTRGQRAGYRCTACGAEVGKWVGRCGACGSWGSVAGASGGPPDAGVPVRATDAAAARLKLGATGVAELDRVLGGGLAPGSVTLLGGEPGIGKSTLLLQAAAQVARRGERVLYVSAEESVGQIRDRAARLAALEEELWFLAEATIDAIVDAADRLGPALLIVDSVQAVSVGGAAPGSVAGVREAAQRLVAEAKARALPTVIVGHVTKDGQLAGPRQLEHVVDTVLTFEGDRHASLRLLRAVKHRFGATDELGLFEMSESGLVDVPDARALFLTDRREGQPGSVVFPFIDGRRPLLVEIQALVVPGRGAAARRTAEGLDTNRFGLLLAMLDRRLGVPVLSAEVYGLALGGVDVGEPAADLAVALAVVGALTDRPVPGDVVVCGELGLAGEVRAVPHLSRRLSEASRAGFRRAIVPAAAANTVADLDTVPVRTLADALAGVGLRCDRPALRRAG